MTSNLPAVAVPRQRLTLSLRKPLDGPEARNQLEADIAALSQPGEIARVMVHASVLLLTFNRGEVDPMVQSAEARYWAKALAGLPEWAVEAACEWYRGADNPRRHWRPVEGDIVERARIEMAGLDVARARIAEFDGVPAPTEISNLKVVR